MSGSGMIAASCEVRRAGEEREGSCCATASLHEREDVLAYLSRRRVNCKLVAGRCPEFADDAKVQVRQLDILIDEIKGGLHEGEHALGVGRARAASGSYPFRDHRTVEELDREAARPEGPQGRPAAHSGAAAGSNSREEALADASAGNRK